MSEDSSSIIPYDLLCRIHQGNCIPFVGSGVSTEAEVGIPSVRELTQTVIQECEIRDISKNYNYSKHQYDSLDKAADDFIRIADNNVGKRGRILLEEIICQEIPRSGNKPLEAGKSCLPYLVNIPWNRNDGFMIFTTNWDRLLEDMIDKYSRHPRDNSIVSSSDIPRLGRDKSKIEVIKLHGTLEQSGTIIVSGDDYNKLIYEKKPIGLYSELERCLAQKTFIFLGYSLRDSSFKARIEAVIDSTRQDDRDSTPPHYAVVGNDPDPNEIAEWKEKGINILNFTAKDFLRLVFIETNQFINRDKERRLDKLEHASLYSLVGPAGVGKSTLLRRIRDDLKVKRGGQANHYKYYLHYEFGRPEKYSLQSRCEDLLEKLAKALKEPRPDISAEVKTRLEREDLPEDQIHVEVINKHLDQLKQKFTDPTLLLFDCTTLLDTRIIRMLERLLEPALSGSNLKAIIASRYPLGWTNNVLKRTLKLNTENLSPFTYINVADWLRYQALLEANVHLEPEHTKDAAKSIIRLTQGYPEAIKLIMNRLSEDPATLGDGHRVVDFIQIHETELMSEIFHMVERQILSDVSDVLRKILSKMLCVFRKFNLNILESLVEHAEDDDLKEALQIHRPKILSEIQTYYLAAEPGANGNSTPMFALDPVVRRLLARHLELTSNRDFVKYHQIAITLFDDWVNRFADDWQRASILENLFHSLEVARLSCDNLDECFACYVSNVSSLVGRLRSSAGISMRPDIVRHLRTQIEQDQEFIDEFVSLFGQNRYTEILEIIQ